MSRVFQRNLNHHRPKALLTAAGLIVAVAFFQSVASKEAFSYIMLILCGINAIISYQIAEEIDANPLIAVLLGFFAPIFSLIIFAFLKRKPFIQTIDRNYPVDIQYKEISKHGKELIGRKRYADAVEVYQYITTMLPHTKGDIQILQELYQKVGFVEERSDKRLLPIKLVPEASIDESPAPTPKTHSSNLKGWMNKEINSSKMGQIRKRLKIAFPKKITISDGIKIVLILTFGAFIIIAHDLVPDWLAYLDDDDRYDTYTALRFVAFLCFALLTYQDSMRKDKTLAIVWGASALLINPIKQVGLGREIWTLFDLAWIGFIFGTLIYERSKRLAKAKPHADTA